MEIKLQETGPLFSGDVNKEFQLLSEDAARRIAEEGAQMISENLHAVIKHPTGYYESHIKADLSGDYPVITDMGVVYGPWLEGVSSRNHHSRFKGYHVFRDTTEKLQARAVELAEQVVPKHVDRMNG